MAAIPNFVTVNRQSAKNLIINRQKVIFLAINRQGQPPPPLHSEQHGTSLLRTDVS